MEVNSGSRIKIIGTSHIASQSIKEIKKSFQDNRPDIIAVELDTARAVALLKEEKGSLSFSQIIAMGVKGFLFAKIGHYLQQKLGRSVGVVPGSEMKAAMELAAKNNLPLALIDQPIQTTLHNFSKELTWKEKFRFVADILKGIFQPRRQIKELGLDNFDLSAVPEKKLILVLVGQLQQRYPNVYKTLVEDRNKYMVKKIIKLLRDNPEKKILVIVGAGHVAGMQELLLKVDLV